MNQDEFRLRVAEMGGYESPIITTTGSAVNLAALGNVIALLPNPGCIFTSIKTGEDAHNHADATHMNLLLKNLGDDSTYAKCPIMVKSPHFFTEATISAGSYRAILI
jgi:hypothetical protein